MKPDPVAHTDPLPPALAVSTGSERAAAVLRRVLDVTARVVRGLTRLAIVAAACGATAWIAWLVLPLPRWMREATEAFQGIGAAAVPK